VIITAKHAMPKRRIMQETRKLYQLRRRIRPSRQGQIEAFAEQRFGILEGCPLRFRYRGLMSRWTIPSA